MKFDSQKKYLAAIISVLTIIFISLLMVITIFKFDKVLSILGIILKALMPIIWGFIIAYLLNPVMKFFEKYVNKAFSRKKPRKKLCRGISVTLTAIFAIVVISSLLYFVLPKLRDSIIDIGSKSEGWIANIEAFLTKFLQDNPEVNAFIMEQFDSIQSYATDFLNTIQPEITSFIQNFTVGFLNFLIGVKDFVLGFIVSIYLLISKEKLLAQFKKVFIAIFSKKICRQMSMVYHRSNKLFSGFIGGKIIDSFIIGILCFIGMNFLNIEYVVLISFIIGVTNVIPFFGPFIGAIPSGLLILLAQPEKIIPFLIFIFLLQQFDGNILGPHILGDSTGLPAFWVMFAIFLGGGLFGFTGMLLGVPTFALIYSLFRSYVETKLENKRLPIDTLSYMGSTQAFYTVRRAKDIISPNEKDDEPNYDDYMPSKKK